MSQAIPVGAAYYAEYQPHDRLDTDLDLMAEAGMTVIRVGESVWSTWEPSEGQFDLDWLQPVLDAAHRRGIHAIVGTPTYAVPPWLRRTYPETTARTIDGTALPYGARQDVDYTHPAFRHLAERLIRAVVGRYANHPAVIGWQVDNEPGLRLFYNHSVFQGFLGYLRDRYGDVETLNRRWGLTYWSHRLGDWADLWPPEGNTTPSYDLAWRRYQARLTHEFIDWQAGIVRDLVPDHHFVTTCIALGQPGLDITQVASGLDVAGTNVYYLPQDGLSLPGADEPAGLYPFFVPWSGPAWVRLQADLSRGTRQEPFLVTETNATSIGGPADNFPAYRGQLRQVALALVARGARMIEYWNWHTLHYGAETYWGGVLGHSLQPGRIYQEISELAAEVSAMGSPLASLAPTSDVCVLVSAESRWSMEFMGPLRGGTGSWTGDPNSYDRILAAFYRGMFDAGLSCDVVSPGQLAEAAARDTGVLDNLSEVVRRWPVLVVCALCIASDDTLELLRAYAEAGGHLVVTPRTGYADEEAVARVAVMPGALRSVAGASYLEYTNLVSPVPLLDGGVGSPGKATAWADGLTPEGARVLARYDHPHLSQFAAITTHEAGRGRVTCVGTVPDRPMAEGLARWLTETSLPPCPWRAVTAAPVTHTAATTPAGDLIHFIHNWGWEPASITLPSSVQDLLAEPATPAGGVLPRGTTLLMGPWDARVLLERVHS